MPSEPVIQFYGVLGSDSNLISGEPEGVYARNLSTVMSRVRRLCLVPTSPHG